MTAARAARKASRAATTYHRTDAQTLVVGTAHLVQISSDQAMNHTREEDIVAQAEKPGAVSEASSFLLP